MAMSARELVFYVRAENQASRVFKSVGRDIGALRRQAEAARNITAVSAATNNALKGRDQTIKQLGTIDGLSQKTYRSALKNVQAENQLIRARQQSSRLIDQANNAYTRSLRVQDQLARSTLNLRRFQRMKTIPGFSSSERTQLIKNTKAQIAGLEQSLIAAKQAEDGVRLAGQRWASDAELQALQARRAAWDGYAASIRGAGHSLQIAGTAGIVASAFLAKRAADFQTQSVLAATQTITPSRNSVKQILGTGAFIDRQLTTMLASGSSVLKPSEATKAAYDIPSGIPSLRGNSLSKAKQTVAIIKELNQVMKANFGLVPLNGLTDAAITLVNTFGTSISKLPHEFDVMQSAVNRGKITMGQFVAGLAKTGPAAAQANYNFDSMASVLSFLSDKIGNYSIVVSGYARSLDIFQNAKFQTYMKAHGQAITDAQGRLLSYEEIIKRILKINPALATKHGNLIAFLKEAMGGQGTIQARRVIAVALKDVAGLEKAVNVIPQNARGLVNAQATALSATGAVKWAQLRTELQAIAIVIGQKMIPAFQMLAKPFEALINDFRDLSPHTQKLVAEFIVFGSTAALLLGTLMVIISPFVRLIGMFGRLGLSAATAEGGFTRAALALRIGFLSVVIVAIGLMIKYHSQVMRVINALGGLQKVLTVVGIAIGSFSMIKLIGGFLGITRTAKNASREVGILRTQLGLLPATVVATIVIEVVLHKQALDNWIHQFQQKLVHWQQNNGIVKWLAKTEADTANLLPGVHVNPKGLLQPLDPSIMKNNPSLGNTPAKNAINTPAYQAFLDSGRKALNAATQARGIGRRRNYRPPTTTNSLDQTIPNTMTTATVMSAVRNIVRLDAISAAHPGSYADAKAAMDALNTLQRKSSKEQFAIAEQLISNLESADKKHTRNTISEATKRANASKKIFEDGAKALQASYSNFYNNEQSAFGQLFSGPFMNSARTQDVLAGGGKPTGSMLLTDIKSQISQFRQWHRVIDKLVKMGMPAEMLQQILQAGPAALPELRALLSLKPVELHSYFSLFKKAFGKGGLLDKATSGDMKNLAASYRSMGKTAALAFIEGLKSEHVPALKVFENMMKDLFPGLWKKTKGATAPDPTHGNTRTKPNPAKPPAVKHGKPHSGHSGGTTHGGLGNSVTYNFNSVAPMDPSTLLRKAKNFHAANYPQSPVTPG